MAKKIFVFGTGRCGTVTMNNILNSLPKTISIHEGVVQNKDGSKRMLGHLKDINKYIFYETNNPEEIKQRYLNTYNVNNEKIFDFLDSYFEKRNDFINNIRNLNYCDVNPYGYMFISYIIKKYPDAKFVHLVRDGRKVVKSYYDRKNSLGINTSYPDGISEIEYSSWHAGKPRPIFGNLYYNEWPKYDRVDKLSWFWNFVNLEIENRLKDVDKKNKYFIRLEELSDKNIKKMLNFLELPTTYDKRFLLADNIGKTSSLIWNEQIENKFLKINKKLMQRYNYLSDK
jgi:hypothetical protein